MSKVLVLVRANGSRVTAQEISGSEIFCNILKQVQLLFFLIGFNELESKPNQEISGNEIFCNILKNIKLLICWLNVDWLESKPNQEISGSEIFCNILK